MDDEDEEGNEDKLLDAANGNADWRARFEDTFGFPPDEHPDEHASESSDDEPEFDATRKATEVSKSGSFI